MRIEKYLKLSHNEYVDFYYYLVQNNLLGDFLFRYNGN